MNCKNIAITHYNYENPINLAYLNFIENAGFKPIVITPVNIKDVYNCSGLLLPGGKDITPELFGKNNTYSFCDPELDKFEFNIFNFFFKRNFPIFGICRGHQLIFYVFFYHLIKKSTSPDYISHNLSFSQHLFNHFAYCNKKIFINKIKHFTTKIREYPQHKVYTFENEELKVNSFHHQGIVLKKKCFDKIKNNNLKIYKNYPIEILAYTQDGMPKEEVLIEALQIRNKPIRSVQWHPEEINSIELIQEFFK